MPRLFVVKASQSKHHWFFNSELFTALANQFDVTIIKETGTSKTPDGNGEPLPEVEVSGISTLSRIAALVWKILWSGSFLGHTFKYRKHLMIEPYWLGMYGFSDVDNWIPRNRKSKILVLALALLMSSSVIYGLIRKLAERTWLNSRVNEVANHFSRGDVVISFANLSYIEMLTAFAADRAGIKTIWIPMTPDDIISNGYHLGNEATVCSWGPWVTGALEQLRDIHDHRIVEAGNTMTRYQERLLADADTKKIHDLLPVDHEIKILTYFVVDNSSTSDSEKTIEILRSVVDELGSNYVLVVRGAPRIGERGEDSLDLPGTKVFFRDPVRIDFAENPDKFWLEHALTLRDSASVIFGTLTSGIYQAAAWGTPIVISAINPEGSIDNPLRPSTWIENDIVGSASWGNYVSSYDEMQTVVRESLIRPEDLKSKVEKIGRSWDYSDPNYVELVFDAVRAASEDKAPVHNRSAE
jgi:hypothetical protein